MSGGAGRGKAENVESNLEEIFASARVAHAPIVNDNPETFDWLVTLLQKNRQAFLDARNSVHYVCDVMVTQQAFDEAAEIGLSMVPMLPRRLARARPCEAIVSCSMVCWRVCRTGLRGAARAAA